MLVFLLEQLHRRPDRTVPVPAWTIHLAVAASAVIVSLAVLVSNSQRQRAQLGAIRLPTTTEEERRDATLVEKDSESGVAEFYPRLRRKKLATLAVVAVLLALELFRVGWDSLAVGPNGWRNWLERVGMVVPWLSVLALAATSLVVEHDDQASPASALASIEEHWRLTVTAFVIAAVSLFVALIRLIVPRSAGISLVPSPALPTSIYRADLALLITSTLLQLAVVLLFGSTRRCAPLVHATTGKEIVAFPSCSPLSYILFAWITPVLKISYHVDVIGEDTLPTLSAADRAKNGWERIRASAHLMDEAPKGWNPLLWRIVVVNKRLFIWRASAFSGLESLPSLLSST